MTETSLRMENGVHAFADLRERQSSTETGFAQKVAEFAPKPPSTQKVVSVVMAIISMGACALWGLAELLNDRPTTGQIEKIMDSHQDNGHMAVSEELRELHDIQIVHGTKLKSIGEAQKMQGSKMDTLILQTAPVVKPNPRNRNPNRNRNR